MILQMVACYLQNRSSDMALKTYRNQFYRWLPKKSYNSLYLVVSILHLFYERTNMLKHSTAAAKSLQLCLTLCDPIDGSHQAPPSLGFSRQERWSGLPFPSPMHESEKWKWSRSVMSDPQLPHGLQPSRLLCPWDFPGKSTGVGCHHLLSCLKNQEKKEKQKTQQKSRGT